MINASHAKTVFPILLVFLLIFSGLWAQAEIIPFDSPRWQLANAKIVDYLGQKAMMGTAFLNDVAFSNGIIEFDLAVTGTRSYPGILFRIRPEGSWERFYIRPHRTSCVPPSLYNDVVQYVASFNRADSWQFYNGEGFTAGAVIPRDRWFHVKIEAVGSQARIYLDKSEKPALQVDRLKHGAGMGGLGLMGPMDGSAYFANFSFQSSSDLAFDQPRPQFPIPGVLTVWELSRPFKALQVKMEQTPERQGLEDLAWQAVSAEADGLVDISCFHPRSGEPDMVFAKTKIYAEDEKILKLNLGYSDYVSVFLNGRMLFSGASPYGSRDQSFLGIVGFYDTVYLPLRKGDNELLLAVAELSGGWGFKVQDGNAVTMAAGVARVWQTPKKLLTPESAAYDPKTRSLYVSNFDPYNRSLAEGKQCVSKLNPEGGIEKLDWVTGLKNPAGMTVYKNMLLVAERNSLVEIDIAKAMISNRFEISGALALNDIAVTPKGIIFISDSAKNIIFKFNQGQSTIWLSGSEVDRPNGLAIAGNKLFWGNNGDGTVKSADLAGKEIKTIAALGPGLIDGIMVEPDGNTLVTHNEGRLMRVSPVGQVTLLLDTTVIGQNLADFTFIPERDLVVFPTWFDGRVTAFHLGKVE